MDAELRGLLDELTSTRDRLAPDEPARADIDRLIARVERKLAGTKDDDDGLVDHLREAAVRFETDHPGLGGALRTVVKGLGAAGI